MTIFFLKAEIDHIITLLTSDCPVPSLHSRPGIFVDQSPVKFVFIKTVSASARSKYELACWKLQGSRTIEKLP